jgi:succinate dehydrogenase / fumarate reductase, iron-sulfur subunit
MKKEKIKLKIFRYNPETDEHFRFEDYLIEIKHDSTVLDALIKIKNEIDGTLSFRHNCKKEMCGSCALDVNKNMVLACKAKISDFKDNDLLVIRPLKSSKIVRDLVIDEKDLLDSIKKIRPYLSFDDGDLKNRPRIFSDDLEKISDSKDCIFCGICNSSCESFHLNDEFIGPMPLLKAHRFVMDPRDDLRNERLSGYASTLSYCAKTYSCTEFCPKEINVSEKISKLKEGVFRFSKNKSLWTKKTKTVFDSLFGCGKMYGKGIFKEKIKNHDEIKKIYREMMLK